jgi:hypothetical protein
MTSIDQPNRGIYYRPGVLGKYLYRVSELYLANHMAPLISARRPETAKLDLVLRGIALSPEHSGRRPPGTVLRSRSPLDYPAIHDLVRPARHFATESLEETDEDSDQRAKKREWVREQLVVLEKRGLLIRTAMGDGRQQITMLNDTGDGSPFDDPGEKETRRSYITVLGSVVADPRYKDWGSPDLAGYACSMVAERYASNRARREEKAVPEVGTGTWFQAPGWFNGSSPHRPDEHLTIPFSSKTIERGLKNLKDQGFIDGRRRTTWRGKRFLHPRMIYTNQFSTELAEVIDLEHFLKSS